MDTCGTDIKDTDSPYSWVPYALGFLALALPVVWSGLAIIEHFHIRSADLTPVVEHPLVRSLVGVGGGMLLFRLLWRPRRSPNNRAEEMRHAEALDEALNVLQGLSKQDSEVSAVLKMAGSHTDPLSEAAADEVFALRLADILDDDVLSDDFDYLQEQLADLLPDDNGAPADLPSDLTVRLSIELVPRSCWLSTLRSALSTEQWDHLRRRVYYHAGRRCEVCGGKGRQWPVEAHETWAYDKESGIQRLEAVRALCPRCHQVKHFGHATLTGKEEEAEEHLRDINNWDAVTSKNYIKHCFAVWRGLSECSWKVDLSLLEQYGFTSDERQALERGVTEHRSIH
jgi:hypothetical protein